MPLSPDLVAKRAALDDCIRTLGRTLVAYSGGVDSAFLAWSAHRVLGVNMLAAIADSPSLARAQLADAIAFAREQGIPLEIIATDEIRCGAANPKSKSMPVRLTVSGLVPRRLVPEKKGMSPL